MWGYPGYVSSLWPAGALAMMNILISSVITCVEEKTLNKHQESLVPVLVFVIKNITTIIINTY